MVSIKQYFLHTLIVHLGYVQVNTPVACTHLAPSLAPNVPPSLPPFCIQSLTICADLLIIRLGESDSSPIRQIHSASPLVIALLIKPFQSKHSIIGWRERGGQLILEGTRMEREREDEKGKERERIGAERVRYGGSEVVRWLHRPS